MSTALLNVDRLSVHFGTEQAPLPAVDHASFVVNKGETVCLVGESGSGKTVTALSILRLEEHRHAKIVSGEVMFDGRGLTKLGERELNDLRGRRVAMVFQEPMTAFDPVFTIGDQIVETILRHEPVSKKVAWERAVALLERVHMPDARLRMRQIPHELSGGMRQRAMIAMALACNPELLIADEPTTALDVTIQAQILALLRELQRESGMGILLITHDLGVAAEMADRVVVMYAGRVAEQGPARALFSQPRHPYTRGLLRSAVPPDSVRGSALETIGGSIPRLDELPTGCRFHPRCTEASARCALEAPALVTQGDRQLACFNPLRDDSTDAAADATRGTNDERPSGSTRAGKVSLQLVREQPIDAAAVPLIEAKNLSKRYTTGRGLFAAHQRVHALDDVSLSIARGETVGLVGESGCGKSTLGRLLIQLEDASSGEVRYRGRALSTLRGHDKRLMRRNMQMIFQDPYSSIDPRWTVGDVISEPLLAHERLENKVLQHRVEELLSLVGLPTSARTRYAHEFSGGQRQRVGIARAIALNPEFIVADEALSALDLSVQAQIVNLLCDLRARLGLTALFIGHGLHVVRHLSDRVGVMYLGRLVEVAPSDQLFARPLHHYTQLLLTSIPPPDPREQRAFPAPIGELPSPTAPPSGCHFHPRCPAATARCKTEAPALREVESGHQLACHHPRA